MENGLAVPYKNGHFTGVIMRLFDKKTGKEVKPGAKIKSNAGKEFVFERVRANGMIDCKDDTDLHPVAFEDHYKVEL